VTRTEERLAQLELASGTLNDRLDTLLGQVDRTATILAGMADRHHEVDKRLAVAEHRLAAIEAKLDELRSRRWEVAKLLLAAVIGSLLTVGSGFANRSLDRWLAEPAKTDVPDRPRSPIPAQTVPPAGPAPAPAPRPRDEPEL